jgi:hypothetical protein
VNRQHFKTFLWLRWRLRVNQFKKGGPVNLVIFGIIAVGALFAAAGMFVGGFFVGWLALPTAAPPAVRLYVWDGIILAFLFSWMIGLLTELQRTESLAIDKFLHLPVSITGAFCINYLSSLLSLTLLVFMPGAIGLVLGQTIAHGPVMLLALPLLAAFVLAITGLTYQFQGWLATLMANPRRRRTVIVMITMGFILIAQLPNLINVARPWEDAAKPWEVQQERQKEISRAFLAKEIDNAEYIRRNKELVDRTNEENSARGQEKLAKIERTTRLFNMVLPPGWLPLGAAGLPDGHVVPALLGILGFGLIGTASLWRAYRTTVRLYTGQFATGESKKSAATPAVTASSKPRMVEWRLPFISEHAAAVATAGFRSLTRAPEAKMALLAPLIMVVVFGGIFFSSKMNPPDSMRPLMAIGGAGVVLLSAIQLIGNQFGYDRTGFRAFVLSPVPRREILMGKNLSVAPFAVVLGVLIIVVIGILFPMRIDHYPAAVIQFIGAYLLFCLLGNILAILTPMAIAPGSMKASNVKVIPVLMQLCFMMLLPIVFIPALIPIGIEALLANLESTEMAKNWPISLVASLLVLAVVVPIFRKVMTWQGQWLLAREQKILEVVTSKSE